MREKQAVVGKSKQASREEGMRHEGRLPVVWQRCDQAAALPCVQVYDKKVDGPRFVFHTAFTDPASPPDAPPRRSIEVRAIAFFDPPPLIAEETATRAAPSSSTG